MRECVLLLRQIISSIVFWIVIAFGMVNISGCAASSNRPSNAILGAERESPLDETEARRRARIRLELAANYFESGQTAVALDEVKQALSNDPIYADAYNLRGLIYMRMNDYVQADNSFRRALAFNLTDPGVLHNYGWLLCQQKKYIEADQQFHLALKSTTYSARSKTLMAQGLCHARADKKEMAESALAKAYDLDPGNPIVSYNLAILLLQRGEFKGAQFYIRHLNNSELANSESLWLGIKIERALGDLVAMKQLGTQLIKRFSESREKSSYERGAFNE